MPFYPGVPGCAAGAASMVVYGTIDIATAQMEGRKSGGSFGGLQ